MLKRSHVKATSVQLLEHVFVDKAVTAKREEIYIALQEGCNSVLQRRMYLLEYFHEGNRSSEDSDKRINKLIARTYYASCINRRNKGIQDHSSNKELKKEGANDDGRKLLKQ